MTLVLLFGHVIEYLWEAIWCFHAPGSEEAERCVGERPLQIFNDKILRHLSADERMPVDIWANCLLKYRDMLHYNDYLAPGLPIATGVIEGACRHLVKDRIDITGARWCPLLEAA